MDERTPGHVAQLSAYCPFTATLGRNFVSVSWCALLPFPPQLVCVVVGLVSFNSDVLFLGLIASLSGISGSEGTMTLDPLSTFADLGV